MKSQVNPIVAVVVVVVLLLGAALFFWKGSQGANSGSGKLQSDLNMDKIEKDPEKLRQSIEESLKKDKERRGQ